MTLKSIRRFRIQSSAVSETVEAIRSVGMDGYELFVVWSGKCEKETFNVFNVHIPEQKSYRTESGLFVRVDGAELHRLNIWLYESKQVIGVQVHGHPTDAYHSDTDNTYPIATQEGSLSIVLPFFGIDGWEPDKIAGYRLGQGGWIEVSESLIDLIEVIDHGFS